MRNGPNESGHNERASKEYQDAETLPRIPAQKRSNIPPRASAHPSALVAVRPKYPRNVSDQQRVTPFDGITSNPPRLTRSAQRKTDDLLIEPIVHNRGDSIPIDEIDTFPPGTQAQLRPGSKRAAHEPISQANTLPVSAVQGKQAEVYPPVATRSQGEPPHGFRQIARSQGFSLEHYVDNVRWWLLFPGRLEFLLWLTGAIVLVFLTSCFLLVMATVLIR